MKAAEESRRHRLRQAAQHRTRITRTRTHVHSAYRARLPTSARSLAISVRCAFTCFLPTVESIAGESRRTVFNPPYCLTGRIVHSPPHRSLSFRILPLSLFFLTPFASLSFFFLFTFLSEHELIYDLLLQLLRFASSSNLFFSKRKRVNTYVIYRTVWGREFRLCNLLRESF